jgi:hypothetical protein
MTAIPGPQRKRFYHKYWFLELFHSLVRHNHNFSRRDYDKLRVTFHRVVEKTDKLEQVVNYVGGKNNGKGRQFDIRSGACGRAVRAKKVLSGSRTNVDYEAYIKELVSEWGFTETDARKLSFSRNSWLAVPIEHEGEVTGVVYLDSKEKEFFPDAIKAQVVWACWGLAVFIDERYK